MVKEPQHKGQRGLRFYVCKYIEYSVTDRFLFQAVKLEQHVISTPFDRQ